MDQCAFSKLARYGGQTALAFAHAEQNLNFGQNGGQAKRCLPDLQGLSAGLAASGAAAGEEPTDHAYAHQP